MPKHTDDIIADVQSLMNRGGLNVVTLTWPEFYELTNRERLKDEFTVKLAAKLKAASLLVSYGNATVVIAKDYRFSPLPT